MSPAANRWPKFDDLPLTQGLPEGCAWAVFDKDGKKDAYGCLNKITPDAVKDAAQGVRDGVSVSLNWPIGSIAKPGFSRKGLTHNVIAFHEDTPLGLHGFDDEVSFNTQCSSQWDSLCHVSHQPSQQGYNGAKPTTQELVQSFGNEDKEKRFPTLNHWHERGGLVGRGVLIDYKAYAAKKGIKYSPFEQHIITIDQVLDIAKHQSVELREGDILIVRTGYTEDLSEAETGEEQERLVGTHCSVGLEGSKAMARWIWDTGFAAVAGDQIALEALPPVKEEGTVGGMSDLVLHQYMLSLFGCHIGELWDLKALGETCARLGRYEFLLTSVPLNVPGGIGSPPNALAIF